MTDDGTSRRVSSPMADVAECPRLEVIRHSEPCEELVDVWMLWRV